MNALQQSLFSILLEIDRICGLRGIRYYLMSGTALGAVRHQGFIPWDDDLDVGLLRPDYERFLEFCKTDLGERFFLQDWRTEPSYFLPFAKLRLNGTTFMSPMHTHLDVHQGVYVDLFPLDGVPGRPWLLQLQRWVLRRLHILLEIKFTNVPNPQIRNRILKHTLRPLLPGASINRLYNAISRLWPVNAAREGIFMSPDPRRVTYPLTWFSEPAKRMFEGREFPVPAECHSYLERTYGNYMQPPPEVERDSGHAALVDLDRDYRHYLK